MDFKSILSGLISAIAVLMGVSVVALSVAQKSGSSGIKWKDKIEVVSGEAYRGPWRMNESEFRYVDDPTVGINGDKAVGVAWADHDRKDIFFQVFEKDGKKRFQEPVNVSRSPSIFSWLPKLVMTSGRPGRVYVLWQEIVFSGGTHGGEIFFARSNDGGKTFQEPINLSTTRAGAGKGRLNRDSWHNGSLDIALGPEGHLYAAWTEYEGPLRFSRSTDGGASFSAPIRIRGGNGAAPARAPALATGGDGAVYIAWTVGEDPAADIHFSESDDHGQTFAEPRILDRTDGHADAPKLAVDDRGTVHLVYAESPGGPLKAYHIRYTRLPQGEGDFEQPRQIAVPEGTRWESMNFPSLSLDGKGNPYIIWELFPKPVGYPKGLGFTFSRDGGQTFASPRDIPGTGDPALGTGGGRQGLLMKKLAVNDQGAIAVAHSTFKRNQSSHVWFLRGEAAGRN
ncbi:MAG: sialidase family protein [Syntrophotaleaceae bacterium]